MNRAADYVLLILSSPSGAGKTTLTRKLQASFPELAFSVSHTTRKERPKEVDGRDYHFVDQAEFDKMVEAGAFLEWAEVHGNHYGTSHSEIARTSAIEGCRGMIFDIDFQGARQIRSKIPDVLTVFILPPSMQELERRLRGRASETEDVVRRRFQAAHREIEHYGLFDYLVVNDQIDEAFEELRAIITAERARRFRRSALAESLLRRGSVLG